MLLFPHEQAHTYMSHTATRFQLCKKHFGQPICSSYILDCSQISSIQHLLHLKLCSQTHTYQHSFSSYAYAVCCLPYQLQPFHHSMPYITSTAKHYIFLFWHCTLSEPWPTKITAASYLPKSLHPINPTLRRQSPNPSPLDLHSTFLPFLNSPSLNSVNNRFLLSTYYASWISVNFVTLHTLHK